MSRCPVARQAAAVSRPTEPVVLLVDAGVRVLQLVRGLATAGLTLKHDRRRNALVVSSAPTASVRQT